MLRRLLIGLVILVGAWVAFSAALFGWAPSATSDPDPAAAVIVLAGGLNSRLDPALVLMRRRVAPVLVISGAFHASEWKKARRLCRGGYGQLRFRVLCPEPHPYSTQGESRMIASLARSHRWSHIVVVTSRFHVTRARMLVSRCYDGDAEFVGTHSPWWKFPGEAVSETGKLLVQLTVQRGC